MAYIDWESQTACCGVAEIVDLSTEVKWSHLLYQAQSARKGLLFAFFLSTQKGNFNWKRLIKAGFKPLPRVKKFVNPNTHNTLYPLFKDISKLKIIGRPKGYEDDGYGNDSDDFYDD